MPINHALYEEENSYKWKGDPNLSITGSGFSVPRGIEATLSYNGLVMNDTSVFDKYRVLSIDGLDDPDIRDSREVRNGEIGEDSWTSYYGGRSIVIKLRIEAYQLDKLRDMEEALRTAFVDMEEKPLYFLTGDPEKDHYITVKKNTSLNKAEAVDQYKGRFFRDWQITLRASDPRFYRAKGKIESVPITIIEPELNTGYESFETDATGYSVEMTGAYMSSGVSTDWASVGTKSLKIENTNNLLFGNDYVTIKRMVSGARANSSFTVSGNCRIDFDWNFSSMRVRPIIAWADVNDYYLSTSLGSWRDFYAGFPASTQDFTFVHSAIAPTGTKKIELRLEVDPNGFPDWKFYLDNVKINYSYVYGVTGSQKFTNIGNYYSDPMITLYGEMNTPIIWNSSAPAPYNNIKFKAGTTIADGDYRQIDIKNRTITDSNGANKFSELDLTSGWLKIYPGDNYLYMDESTTFGTGTNSSFAVSFKDAWV